MSENDEVEIICPFCGNAGFDKLGLKLHFEHGWCDVYEETNTDQFRGINNFSGIGGANVSDKITCPNCGSDEHIKTAPNGALFCIEDGVMCCMWLESRRAKPEAAEFIGCLETTYPEKPASVPEGCIDFVFEGPNDANPGNFVEVECPPGKSITFGEWLNHADGFQVLRFTARQVVDAIREAGK